MEKQPTNPGLLPLKEKKEKLESLYTRLREVREDFCELLNKCNQDCNSIDEFTARGEFQSATDALSGEIIFTLDMMSAGYQ